MGLTIVILNWNAAADTTRCIEYISSWQRLKPTLWVIDNASQDGSAEIIARDYPEVRLICNSVNQGYAGGNNQALVDILEQGDPPILLLNNDAFIDEENLIRLMHTLHQNPRIGFLGPLLFDAQQKDHLLTAGGQSPIYHLSSHVTELKTDRPLHLVDYVPGTVILGRAKVYRAVGLLDEAYFFSGELPDLCERARRQGFLSAVDTQARAYHAVDRSSRFRSTLYTYYIIRNRFLFIRKFGGNLKIFFYCFWGLYSIALFLKMQLKGHHHTAKAIRLGLLDGLQGRFGGQNERVLAACTPNIPSVLKPDRANQQP